MAINASNVFSLALCFMVGSISTVFADTIDEERSQRKAEIVADSKTNARLSNSVMIARAKQKIAKTLKDPDSAKFSEVKVFTGGGARVVCGKVNAKNSYGGYAGAQMFMSDAENISFMYGDTAIYDEFCR